MTKRRAKDEQRSMSAVNVFSSFRFLVSGFILPDERSNVRLRKRDEKKNFSAKWACRAQCGKDLAFASMRGAA